MRKQYDPAFKVKVALEAVKGERTMAQLFSDFKVHSNLIGKWKKQLLQELPSLFSSPRGNRSGEDSSELVAELYRQIGQLKVELDWLKKNPNSSARGEAVID